MSTTLIRAARVIDPAADLDAIADIAIRDSRIVEVRKVSKSSRPSTLHADHIIDAQGLIASPGLIDPHVHLREPGGEDAETIESGSASAVAGGFTSVCCMPNTTPAIDDDAMVEFVYTKAEQTALCRVYPCGAATKGRRGEELAQIALMAKAGAVAFTDDGDAIASPGLMLRALTYIGPTGLAFMQHCQEPTLTRGSSMHAGEVSTRLGLGGWPRIAEELIIERDIRLLRAAGSNGPRYHVQHISAAGSVDLIRQARKAGLKVSGEASPHHLTLTHNCVDLGQEGVAQDLALLSSSRRTKSNKHTTVLNSLPQTPTFSRASYWTLAKMNPPLRERSDINALLEGIADGTITILATDHAPHPHERKAIEFENAAFGILGLETALGLYIKALIEPGVIDWPKLIAMMTINPAQLCNLDRPELAAMGVPKDVTSINSGSTDRSGKGLGTLAVGSPADVTLIDPELEWTVDAEQMKSKSRNTPYHSVRLKGRAVHTIVAGFTRWSMLETERAAAR